MAKSQQIKYTPKQPMAKKVQVQPQEIIAPLDSKNQVSNQVFWGVLIVGELLGVSLGYFGIKGIIEALGSHPVVWGAFAVGLLSLALAIFAMVVTIRASLLMGAIMAARTSSWALHRKFCEKAISLKSFIPGGAAWAVQMLIQQKLQNSEFDEVISEGSAEFERALQKNPKEQSLGALCAYISMAYQQKNDIAHSIEWGEKSIAQYKLMFEDLAKGKGKKIAGDMLDGARLQYAAMYLQNGVAYMARQDYRAAKERFNSFYEVAKPIPDSTEKQQMVKVVQEHLQRLKHW